MKKLGTLFAAVILIMVFAVSANALESTGQCGDNVYWNFDESTGELVISGTGAMNDYSMPSYNPVGSPFACSCIKSVVIEEGVTSIGRYMFYDCDKLVSVEISSTVESIGDVAFSSCGSLKNITIPDKVQRIGANAFSECIGLEGLIIGKGVLSIYAAAFSHCDSLISVNIPDNVTSIGNMAFERCTNLKSVNMGNGVKSIGKEAFYFCPSLISVTIPYSVTDIGRRAFYACYNLTNIEVDIRNNYYCDIDGVLFNKCITELIQYPSNNTRTLYEIPDGVTRVGADAFYNSKNLMCVTIPNSVINIDRSAFENCISLASVLIPESVTSIGDGSFSWCTNLTSITIPDSVISLGENAFYECISLTSAIIGNGLKSISDRTFYCCTSLQSITIGNNVTNIGKATFSMCEKLVSITIPESLKNIDDDAFYCCTNLSHVFYKGTKEQWNKISVGLYNENLTSSTIVYSYHTHFYTSKIIKPTCATKGYTIYTCTCNDSYISDYIDKLDHEYISKITTPATHLTEGVKTFTCECGDFYTELVAKLEDHTYEKIVTKATCTTKGYTNYICECGDTYTETIPATNHPNATTDAGKAPTTTEVGYTAGKYCPDCKTWIEGHEEIPMLHTHKYTSSVTEQATCTSAGTKTYTCSCGDTYTEAIPATNHANTTTDPGKAPTTTEVGYTAGKYCPDCETWLEGHIEIPKLEAHVHSYTSTITTEPTCTTAGTTTYTCTCGDTYTESIPAINHANATTDAGKEPTTTEVGYTAGKYCPDCKTWIEGHEEISMLHTHTYTSTVTKEATCWREGEKTYTCTCGDSYTEAIAKLDHEYRPWETKKNPTCTAPGLEWSYCLLCDNDFEREIPATGHTIIDYTRRATPDSDGAYVTACDVCNEVFKSISFGRPTEYKLSTAKYTYDGKTKTPKLTVETSDGTVLKEGVDYELELPSGRKAVGVYTYRVVFKGNFLGEKKVSYQILPGKTTSASATQSTDSIKLTWKKVTGATGYRVYQYNSSTGKYKTLKTLTGTSYTVKNLKAGTTYKFAVKAYSKADGETLWASSYKTITTTTKPATPTLKATAGSKQATISWKKVTGATGYVVYMQDEFGDYEKIGTTKNTSYTRKKLTKGETYYFRVRAYKTVDGKNIYGGYKTVKVKVK